MFDFFGENVDHEKLKDELIARLEAKYKKKFHPIILEPRGYQIRYDKLRVYAEGEDKETAVAHIARFGEGNDVRYIDNYFGIHIRDEYETIIKNLALKVFDEVKVFSKFAADSFSDNLTCDNNYQDAIDAKAFLNATFDVFVKEQLMDKDFLTKIKDFVNLLKLENLHGSYLVAHLKNPWFEKVNRTNYSGFTQKFTPMYNEICFDSKSGNTIR